MKRFDINANRILFIFDSTSPQSKCYKCLKRPCIIGIFHGSRDDYASLNAIWVEWINGLDATQWCIECLLRCEQLGEETLQVIQDNVQNLPTKEELDNLTQFEEDEKRRDNEEKDCVCKKHIRLCCPADYKSKDELYMLMNFVTKPFKNEIVDGFNSASNSTDLNDYLHLQDEVEQKFEEYLTIYESTNDYKKIIDWLLWTGDYEYRNRKMFELISNYDFPPDKKKQLTTLITIARISETKTICGHILPRPYNDCTCNFSYTHKDRLVDLIEYSIKKNRDVIL
jgi:hypothetical protein